MISILLVITAIYLVNLALKRVKFFISNTFGFENDIENYKVRVKNTNCPKQLEGLYGELLEFHNQKAEFDFQKRNVRVLIGIVNARIEMSR